MCTYMIQSCTYPPLHTTSHYSNRLHCITVAAASYMLYLVMYLYLHSGRRSIGRLNCEQLQWIVRLNCQRTSYGDVFVCCSYTGIHICTHSIHHIYQSLHGTQIHTYIHNTTHQGTFQQKYIKINE